MKQKASLLAATLFGLSAVAIGAFGSHGLKAHLINLGRTDTFHLAVEYQFYHTFALLAAGILQAQLTKVKLVQLSGVMFSIGIFFFSGSLYVLSLTNVKILGAITPIGGLCFLAGWALLFYAVSTTRFNTRQLDNKKGHPVDDLS